MAEVNGEGLAGEQVRGHGVAAEGVHDQEIEVLGWLAFQREAAVAHDELDLSVARSEVAEGFLGELLHGGINLVDAQVIAGFAVGGDGADAETEEADALVLLAWKRSQGEAESAARTEIRGERARAFGGYELDAVGDASMQQQAVVCGRVFLAVFLHGEDAVEIPRAQERAARCFAHLHAEHDDQPAEAEAEQAAGGAMAVQRLSAAAQQRDEGGEQTGGQPNGPVQPGVLRVSPEVFDGRKQRGCRRAQPSDDRGHRLIGAVDRADGEQRREHAPTSWAERRVVLGRDHEQERDQQREAEVQFVVVVENSWGDECDEQSAQRASGGDEQVERGEVCGVWLEAIELSVADHGAHPKSG